MTNTDQLQQALVDAPDKVHETRQFLLRVAAMDLWTLQSYLMDTTSSLAYIMRARHASLKCLSRPEGSVGKSTHASVASFSGDRFIPTQESYAYACEIFPLDMEPRVGVEAGMDAEAGTDGLPEIEPLIPGYPGGESAVIHHLWNPEFPFADAGIGDSSLACIDTAREHMKTLALFSKLDRDIALGYNKFVDKFDPAYGAVAAAEDKGFLGNNDDPTAYEADLAAYEKFFGDNDGPALHDYHLAYAADLAVYEEFLGMMTRLFMTIISCAYAAEMADCEEFLGDNDDPAYLAACNDVDPTNLGDTDEAEYFDHHTKSVVAFDIAARELATTVRMSQCVIHLRAASLAELHVERTKVKVEGEEGKLKVLSRKLDQKKKADLNSDRQRLLKDREEVEIVLRAHRHCSLLPKELFIEIFHNGPFIALLDTCQTLLFKCAVYIERCHLEARRAIVSTFQKKNYLVGGIFWDTSNICVSLWREQLLKAMHQEVEDSLLITNARIRRTRERRIFHGQLRSHPH
eukprot:gene22775-29942_t